MRSILFKNNLLDEATGVRKTSQSIPGVDSKQVRFMQINMHCQFVTQAQPFIINSLIKLYSTTNMALFSHRAFLLYF